MTSHNILSLLANRRIASTSLCYLMVLKAHLTDTDSTVSSYFFSASNKTADFNN